MRPSYDLLVRRFEALENRGRALLTFARTITVAAPAFALAVLGRAAPTVSTLPFLVAMVAFAGSVICAVVLTRVGRLDFIDPAILHESYIGQSEVEFRLSLLHYAGKHFAANSSVLSRLALITDVMSVLLFLETGGLTIWIATAGQQPTYWI